MREGFPPTHELLDRAFARMLERIEHVLADQEFLLGNRFTLADASAYGQLAMNLKDPSASDLIATRAPLTYAWLERIADGRAWRISRDGAGVEVSSRLSALLEEIAATFVPLMRQNEAAYERHRAAGESIFNEAAFDAGRALYDGDLCGVPFRSVAKTFQVAVWRRLRDAWDALEPAARSALPFAM